MKLGSESEILEYKKSTSELKEGIISIVAILNKHNGGELYFGLKNDGTPVGQDISGKTLRDVSQAINNHIEPHIYPDISNVVIGNKHCIRVVFEGNNVPYYAFGRAYLRVADEDRVMAPKELESYILKKNINKTDWDSEASEKTVEDIDEKLLRDYIGKANISKRINYTYTDKYDILKRLNLLNGNNISNTAKVMFCSNVNLEMQMAIFATDERLTFIDIARERGTILELVDIAERYIKKNTRWRVEFDGSRERKEIPEVPIEAVREALINSFCHKDYRLSQNNEVAIYRNRIEIYNSGTFPDGLTPQDFIETSERSVQRNPLLAQTLYYSEEIERFGTGLRRIITSCQEAGVKVEFQMLKLGFVVVFYRQDVSEIEVDKMGRIVAEESTDYTDITDKSTDIADKSTDITDKSTDLTDKNSRETRVIEYLKVNGYITNKEVCELLSTSTEASKRLLQSMVQDGLIIAEGENKGRKYKIHKH